jgi:hypothetical protein
MNLNLTTTPIYLSSLDLICLHCSHDHHFSLPRSLEVKIHSPRMTTTPSSATNRHAHHAKLPAALHTLPHRPAPSLHYDRHPARPITPHPHIKIANRETAVSTRIRTSCLSTDAHDVVMCEAEGVETRLFSGDVDERAASTYLGR